MLHIYNKYPKLNRSMGLLPDTQNCELCLRREFFPLHRLQRKPLVSDPSMHYGTCVTHGPWFMSREKRSGHSLQMRNPQFYVFGKRPIGSVTKLWEQGIVYRIYRRYPVRCEHIYQLVTTSKWCYYIWDQIKIVNPILDVMTIGFLWWVWVISHNVGLVDWFISSEVYVTQKKNSS